MESRIENQLKELKDKGNSDAKFYKTARKLNFLDWISICFRLDGKDFNIERVYRLLQGESFPNSMIGDYTDLERYKKLVKFSYNSVGMDNSFDHHILEKMYKALHDGEVNYRRINPLILDNRYSPIHSSNIQKSIKEMEINLYHKWQEGSVLEKAAYISGCLVEIAPFEEDHLQIAASSSFHYLLSNGYPIPTSDFDRDDFIERALEFVDKKNITPLLNLYAKNINKKLDMLLQA